MGTVRLPHLLLRPCVLLPFLVPPRADAAWAICGLDKATCAGPITMRKIFSWACACMCVCVRDSYRSVSGAFLHFLWIWDRVFPLNLELADSARLTGPWTLGTHLSIPPPCWDCRNRPSCHTFKTWVPGIKPRSSCLQDEPTKSVSRGKFLLFLSFSSFLFPSFFLPINYPISYTLQ